MNSSGGQSSCDAGEGLKKVVNVLEGVLMADWRKLFSADVDQALHYYPPPLKSNAEMIVILPSNLFEEGE